MTTEQTDRFGNAVIAGVTLTDGAYGALAGACETPVGRRAMVLADLHKLFMASDWKTELATMRERARHGCDPAFKRAWGEYFACLGSAFDDGVRGATQD